MIYKRKTWWTGFHQIKTFCSLKDTDREKIFRDHITDKRIISTIYKEN